MVINSTFWKFNDTRSAPSAAPPTHLATISQPPPAATLFSPQVSQSSLDGQCLPNRSSLTLHTKGTASRQMRKGNASTPAPRPPTPRARPRPALAPPPAPRTPEPTGGGELWAARPHAQRKPEPNGGGELGESGELLGLLRQVGHRKVNL